MTGIQVLLVAAVLVWLARYLLRLRSTRGTRIIAVVAAVAGTSLVVFPDLATRLARLFGVVRGVDLVIYVTMVAFGFLWLHQTVRIRELEIRLVDLGRRIALDGAAGQATGEGAPVEASEAREPASQA